MFSFGRIPGLNGGLAEGFCCGDLGRYAQRPSRVANEIETLPQASDLAFHDARVDERVVRGLAHDDRRRVWGDRVPAARQDVEDRPAVDGHLPGKGGCEDVVGGLIGGGHDQVRDRGHRPHRRERPLDQRAVADLGQYLAGQPARPHTGLDHADHVLGSLSHSRPSPCFKAYRTPRSARSCWNAVPVASPREQAQGLAHDPKCQPCPHAAPVDAGRPSLRPRHSSPEPPSKPGRLNPP